MTRIAPIKLNNSSSVLWFDARDLDLSSGDKVVTLTARGMEFGVLSGDVFEATEEQISKLKSPLKPVKRVATEDDIRLAQELQAKGAEALPIFKSMVSESGIDMHPVSVEYLLDGDKAVFYFESEERVDFRDLVRKLAAHFHVRVDMRQIGVRDEARMVGGLGHCGQELCCKRLGGEFCPVSIRMAKEQDLSLNPQKISGVCGRLMCCLLYEFDVYKDFKSRAPKMNASISTPDGVGKVVDLDALREIVSVKLEGENAVKVPLCAFSKEGDSVRPNCVCKQGWLEALDDAQDTLSNASTFLTSQFTASDKLAEAGSVRHTGSGKSGKQKQRQNAGASAEASKPVEAKRKPRRRSTKVTADATEQVPAKQREQEAPRKGKPSQQPSSKQNGEQPKRKRTRRGSQQRSQEKQAERKQGSEAQVPASSDQGQAKRAVRPGQKSSGLRNPASKQQTDSSRRQKGVEGSANKGASSRKSAPSAESSSDEKAAKQHRRPRRRTRKPAEGTQGTNSQGE